MAIPIIDIFAGPGGLGEGFSSISVEGDRIFDIRLSIEKNEHAHKTLLLRSFYRKFNPRNVPPLYYAYLKENNRKKQEKLLEQIKIEFKEKWTEAENEAWNYELPYPEEYDKEGLKKGGYTEEQIKERHQVIDERILRALPNNEEFLLIGGPPCQAYSLVGRARNQGISKEDHRVHLYKEYLRIIAKHHPAIFVMENVKGLLSAKVNGEKVFDWIKRDLQNPGSVFVGLDSHNYRIYSLSTPSEDNEDPKYKNDRDFLIQAEKYGVSQKRHRLILLGVREDFKTIPGILVPQKNQISLKEIIGDLPKLRSGLGRTFEVYKSKNGKEKRSYRQETDSDENWAKTINEFKNEIISWNGFAKDYSDNEIKPPLYGTGAEFIEYETPSDNNPLAEWYKDTQDFRGACNHITRTHLTADLKRYMFSSMFAKTQQRFPRLHEFETHGKELLPDHKSAKSGKFVDRFRVQMADEPATTVTSHISKDGHYFIHYDPNQCRSLTVREAARIQTFPDNYYFCGSRTHQYHQVGNAVPPYLAKQIGEIVLKIFNEMNDEQ